MIPAAETFSGTWPYKAKYSDVNGFRQHYVDEGPRDGQVVVCLHGEPTWGYLYRNFIKELSKHYRVVVPDHMGFGKSETPQDKVYTLKTHTENLIRLIEDLDLKDITMVGQDWGGPIMGAYTIRNPERIKRVVLMNTLFGYGGVPPKAEKTPWFKWIEKHEEAGSLQGIVGELGSTVLSVMKIVGFNNSAAVDQTWIDAYSAPFPDRASCIGAIEFPLDVHYGRIGEFIVDGIKNGDLAALKSKAAMMIYGMDDRAIDPETAIADFEAIYPGAPVTRLEGVSHFCQEDAPEIIIPMIHQFIQMT